MQSYYVSPVVADDASYYRPPDEFFWKWLPRVARRDPKTGETLSVERNGQLDTALLIGDLRKRLNAAPNATAVAYFSEHGRARHVMQAGGSRYPMRVRDAGLVRMPPHRQQQTAATRLCETLSGPSSRRDHLSNDSVVKSASAGSQSPSICPFKA
ncbi:hypothetical protein RSO01_30900 [Reyranella soli]|uniref:Uncharacterized protein n=1 Tax=Reyranella soli TaxID=1230389 RepID=A0A512NAC2_9HYPH|nr:hypothetical protein RSO01_30900 [Reyranella soli]